MIKPLVSARGPKLEPVVRVTRYTVSCLPEAEIDRSSWDLIVEERGPDSWAVLSGSYCLGRRGKLVYEPSPSRRSDAFKKAYRFPLEEALKIARTYAPTIVRNGMKPADVLALRAARGD